ncbi:DNA mismatch repair protein MLH3-like [Curcuma longa]|uniref:DNA mismatch repair protein MLH3-like n=1 Tax=Curcuma longa TaxID=136217 RepID=UPI003D9F986C
MNPVKRLPRSVHGPLRSSVLMFDLPRVVEELVNNSLDAGAAKVSVFVNVRTCYIKVEDDGRGITRDELVILGEKRATSKSALLDDIKVGSHGLGSEGDMMLSLSDISIVEIRTKARGKPNAYCKIIKGSRCLFLGIDDQQEDVGTTVVVRDLFYDQPVRRRFMQSRLFSLNLCTLSSMWLALAVESLGLLLVLMGKGAWVAMVVGRLGYGCYGSWVSA